MVGREDDHEESRPQEEEEEAQKAGRMVVGPLAGPLVKLNMAAVEDRYDFARSKAGMLAERLLAVAPPEP